MDTTDGNHYNTDKFAFGQNEAMKKIDFAKHRNRTGSKHQLNRSKISNRWIRNQLSQQYQNVNGRRYPFRASQPGWYLGVRAF